MDWLEEAEQGMLMEMRGELERENSETTNMILMGIGQQLRRIANVLEAQHDLKTYEGIELR